MIPLLTRKDLSARLRVSLATLDRMTVSGDMPPAIWFGKALRFDPAAVDAWIAARAAR